MKRLVAKFCLRHPWAMNVRHWLRVNVSHRGRA